jgi:hypothetical protein
MFPAPELVYTDIYMMGVPYFLAEILSVELPTSCRHKKHCDPNSTMSLCKNTSPVCPPRLPPLAPLHLNTNVGIHLALAMLNSVSSQNANVESVDDAFFLSMSENISAGGGEILGQDGPFEPTNSTPSSPTILFTTPMQGGEGGDDDGACSADANLGSIFPSAAPTLNLRYNNQNPELSDKGYDSEGGLPHFADNDEGADPEGYDEAPLNSAVDAFRVPMAPPVTEGPTVQLTLAMVMGLNVNRLKEE